MQTAEVTVRMDSAHEADFAAFLTARQSSLLRTAYLLTGDTATAEDVVQTALAKLYLSWDKVRDRGAIDGYVRRILVNECNSLWRRAWKRREVSTDSLPDVAVAASDDDLAGDVWAVVSTLPRRQREVIVLRYYEQLTEAEIAATLGIAEGTVKSQASRALATLRGRVPASILTGGEEE